MSRVLMHLETLTCPTCIKKIEDALIKTKGVEKVTLLFHSSKVKAYFDPNIMTANQLKQVVENLGYKVINLKVA